MDGVKKREEVVQHKETSRASEIEKRMRKHSGIEYVASGSQYCIEISYFSSKDAPKEIAVIYKTSLSEKQM